MILFIGDVDRGTRDREAFQEIDFAGDVRADRQMGGADRRRARASPNMSRAPMPRRDERPAGPGRARAARGHAARRGRGGRPPAGRPVAAGRRRRSALDAARRLLAAAERPVAIVGGAGWDDAARRGTSPTCAERCGMPRRRRVPPAGRDPQRLARPMPAISATAPTPSWSQRVKRRRPVAGGRRAARRGDDRRLHADHPRSSRARR